MDRLKEVSFHGPLVHTFLHVGPGLLEVRDAVPSDAEAYVNYWHHSGEEIKDLLGIDRKKLGTPEDSRKRFLEMIRVPGANQANIVFTITLNSEVIGYTNINWHGATDSYVHLHTYHSSVRSALKAGRLTNTARAGASLAAVLIGLIKMYFDLFLLERVVLQTRTTNRWINRALDLYMPPAETKHIADPPGLAAPGECHVRYVRREDGDWMRRQAEYLGKSDRPVRDPSELYELR